MCHLYCLLYVSYSNLSGISEYFELSVASIAMRESSFVICYSYSKFLNILINDFNLSVRISKYDDKINGAFVFSAVKDCF
jgi:hypothetical protein